MVAMLCSNELFVSALKLKNGNCGISPLIIWVKFIIKSTMYHNLLDKNMFPVHIPKLHRAILIPRLSHIKIKRKDIRLNLYIFYIFYFISSIYISKMYIYIYIYIHVIHHWRILWSSYRKLAWVGFEPTTTEFCSIYVYIYIYSTN